MGISVRIEDENGHASAELLDPRAYLNALLNLPFFDGPSCVRFIDPYGQTVFNQLQLPILIAELEVARSKVTDAEARREAETRLDAARRARWDPNIIRGYEEAVERAGARPLLEYLDALIALARKATGVHTYLKFYGD
jgi:hypothetical protein